MPAIVRSTATIVPGAARLSSMPVLAFRLGRARSSDTLARLYVYVTFRHFGQSLCRRLEMLVLLACQRAMRVPLNRVRGKFGCKAPVKALKLWFKPYFSELAGRHLEVQLSSIESLYCVCHCFQPFAGGCNPCNCTTKPFEGAGLCDQGFTSHLRSLN